MRSLNSNSGQAGPVIKLRVVLQDRTSRHYFHSAKQWTPDIQKATDFKQTYLALEFAGLLNQADLDIVLTFGDPKYDFRIAVPNRAPPDAIPSY